MGKNASAKLKKKIITYKKTDHTWKHSTISPRQRGH